MPLGTYTLAQLVAIVRAALTTYVNVPVSTTDIEDALNLKQNSVFMLMPRDMKKFWFGKIAAIASVALDATTAYLAGTKPTDMWDTVGMKRIWTDTIPYRQDLDRIDLGDFEEYIKNRFQDVLGYAVFADKVYFSSTVTLSTSTFVCAYIRVPTAMTSGSVFDLPNQFADVVVAMAAAHCVAQASIATEARATALQVFAMMEQEARAAAGLPLQSDVETKELNAAAGHAVGSTTGGSKGSTRPTVD